MPEDSFSIRQAFVKHLNPEGPLGEVQLIEGRDVREGGPEASVLIPTSDAWRGGYFPQLLEQLRAQDFQDFEVIVVKGDTRSGRAINTGAALARGQIVIILDDDTRLGHPEVFGNLVRTLHDHPEIGMAGVANTIPGDASWLVRRVMKEIPRRSSEIVHEIIESDMAETPCCTIPKRVFHEVGGANEIIPRGLDPYLRREIRRAGYKVVVIPDTYIHHLPPSRIFPLIKQFFRNGRQSAFCTIRYPQWVVELTEQHGDEVPGRRSLIGRTFGMLGRLARALLSGKFILLATSFAYLLGFGWQWTLSSRGQE